MIAGNNSIHRLLRREKCLVIARHKKKFDHLLSLKETIDGPETSPNETILNLTGQQLADRQIEVLRLGVRHGLATQPNQLEMLSVAEDVWHQLNRLDKFKDGHFTKDKVKNSLHCFTYNYIDLDLKPFSLGRKRISILKDMNTLFSILKPDKGNGVVIMKKLDYISSVNSLFDNPLKFKKIPPDHTSIRLTSLHNYLSSLLKRGEISGDEFKFMLSKAAHFGRAHGLPKTHKPFSNIPQFRPIIDPT